MKVLITGATGFIGSHLALSLLKEGHSVHLISSQKMTSSDTSVCWETMNLEDYNELDRLRKIMDHTDHCCFLAARKPLSNGSDDLLRRNRLIDELSADAFASSNCASGIYISGLSIFPASIIEEVTEDTMPNPTTDYAQSKLTGEEIFQKACELAGKDWKILRLNAPYGPAMFPDAVIHKFLFRAIAGNDLTLYGDGQRTQHFTWVEDCCKAIKILFDKESGIFHFCGPDKVSMKTLAEYCINITGSQSRIHYEGVETGESCPDFCLDQLETNWPRSKRTTLEVGLRRMSEVMRENHIPLQRLCN
jgi:UDP-glucose 4-epimerase